MILPPLEEGGLLHVGLVQGLSCSAVYPEGCEFYLRALAAATTLLEAKRQVL